MSVSILVATPHAAFGELLRLSLEESGQYQVRLVQSTKEALASAARSAYQLAILDSDLSEDGFVSLCYDLISQMRVIVIPPDNDPNHPSLGGLIPHGYLSRPFYLPDLLETIEHLCNAEADPEPQAAPSAPAWANDPAILKRALEKELEGTEAIAAMVGVQGNLLGSAGRLNEASAQEMASVLLRYWNPNEKTDLMRYVRLSSTKGDYLAYATEIGDELVLMMVFDPSAQLSQVRPQTKQIAIHLVSHLTENPPAVPADPTINTPLVTSNNGHTDHDKTLGTGLIFEHASSMIEPDTERLDDDGLFSVDGESFINANPAYQPPQANSGEGQADDTLDLLDENEEDLTTRKIDLSQLLGTIPSPDPGASPEPSLPVNMGVFSEWVPEPDSWKTNIGTANVANAPTESDPTHLPPEQEQSADPQHFSEEVEYATRPVLRRQAESSVPASLQMPIFMEPEPEIDPLGDTRPHVVSTLTNINQMEPVSPALSLLNYTCVLLPRLPQHYLTGDLADRLAQWVQHLCLAFGWRLEGISLRPEYLQWTVQVAPSVSPGNLVRIIRQRTSLHIFSTFEHIKQQNPSGDFWATGYLIVSGPQPPSAQLLREYIAQTRKRQGIPKM